MEKSGFSERLAASLLAGRYVTRKQTPDYRRFGLKNGIDTSYLYRWLYMGQEPRAASLFHLADALGVDPRWLACGDNETGPTDGGLRPADTPLVVGSGGRLAPYRKSLARLPKRTLAPAAAVGGPR